MPASLIHQSIAIVVNPSSNFILENRSSSTAAITLPSFSNAAAES